MSSSSARWIARQAADPFVAEARRKGYRSRSALKLEEIHAATNNELLAPRATRFVVDLGAAPGGWTQVVTRVAPLARVVAVDLLGIEPFKLGPNVANVTTVRGDFRSAETRERIAQALFRDSDLAKPTTPPRVDVVLCDAAPNTTGDPQRDHLLQVALARDALAYAAFARARRAVFKIFDGSEDFAADVRGAFPLHTVRRVKPRASRKESRELYVVALPPPMNKSN